MSKKQKLIDRIKQLPKDFTWDEAAKLMKMCNFDLIKNDGSARMFRHSTGIKVRIHQPHPTPVLPKYAIELLIEGLRNSGEMT